MIKTYKVTRKIIQLGIYGTVIYYTVRGQSIANGLNLIQKIPSAIERRINNEKYYQKGRSIYLGDKNNMNKILNKVADSIKFELPVEEINIKLPKISDIVKQGLKKKFRQAKKSYRKYSKKKRREKRHDQYGQIDQKDEALINSILRECGEIEDPYSEKAD